MEKTELENLQNVLSDITDNIDLSAEVSIDATKRKVSGGIPSPDEKFYIIKTIKTDSRNNQNQIIRSVYIVGVLEDKVTPIMFNASLVSGTGTDEKGTRYTPDSICPQGMNSRLVYKRLIGVTLPDIASKMQAKYGIDQLYQIAASVTINAVYRDSNGTQQTYQKTIAAVVTAE